MSKRLLEIVSEVLLKEGRRGRARLGLAIDRDSRMVDRYVKGKSRPSHQISFQLALACGCTEQEARQLALEASIEDIEALKVDKKSA